VLIAISGASNRATEQLEIAVTDDLEIVRKLGSINSRGRTARQDEFTFVLAFDIACAEQEAYGGAAFSEASDSGLNSGGLASEAEVVQVGIHQVKFVSPLRLG
jgi:hypothetical protein